MAINGKKRKVMETTVGLHSQSGLKIIRLTERPPTISTKQISNLPIQFGFLGLHPQGGFNVHPNTFSPLMKKKKVIKLNNDGYLVKVFMVTEVGSSPRLFITTVPRVTKPPRKFNHNKRLRSQKSHGISNSCCSPVCGGVQPPHRADR